MTLFVLFGALALGAGVGMLFQRNAVHAALLLVVNLLSVAVLFLTLGGEFLFVAQIIVYAGAIVVLFLFVIMLLGVDREEDITREPLPGQRPAALVAGVLVVLEVLVLAGAQWVSGARSSTGALSGDTSNVEKLARAIFTRYLLPFEATSVLLVIAVIGAVVLARRSQPREDKEVAGS